MELFMFQEKHTMAAEQPVELPEEDLEGVVGGLSPDMDSYAERLRNSIQNNMVENITVTESKIRDVDMAKEMTEYTRNNILDQAAQEMLAGSNQVPQSVLTLRQ